MPVLIAAVFLAIIGGSVGLALGLHSRDDTDRAADGRTATRTTEPTPPRDPVPPDSGPNNPEPDDPGPDSPELPAGNQLPDPWDALPDASDVCQEEIGRRTGMDLEQALYLRTAGYEVWICRDSEGELYYQGHRGGPEERPIQPDGENWLFLTGVIEKDGAYVAVNTNGLATVTYTVSPELIEIEFSDGSVERETAIVPSV